MNTKKPQQKKTQQLIVVLGMHRSGTSALAGVMKFLGAEFDTNLVEAVPEDNPKGYWESSDVVKINNEILSAFGMHYMDFIELPRQWIKDHRLAPLRQRISEWCKKVFDTNEIVVLKDPRLCRTLPFWEEVFFQERITIKCFFIIRHPMEVVRSLQARDKKFSTVHGVLAWFAHIFDTLSQLKSCETLILEHRAFITRPILAIDFIAKNIGFNFDPSAPLNAKSIEDFIDPTLVHHCFNGDIPFQPLGEIAQSVFNLLSRYHLRGLDDGLNIALKPFESQFNQIRIMIKDIIDPLNYQNSQLRNQLDAVNHNASAQIEYRDQLIEEFKQQLDEVNNNASAQIDCCDKLILDLQMRAHQCESDLKNFKELFNSRRALLMHLIRRRRANE